MHIDPLLSDLIGKVPTGPELPPVMARSAMMGSYLFANPVVSGRYAYVVPFGPLLQLSFPSFPVKINQVLKCLETGGI